MLEQASRLLLDELANHVAEHGADGVEPLVGSADIVESIVIEEDLLNDEYGDRLAQLGAGLHDAQAERDDLCGQEEVDDFGGVVLDERTNDAEGGETEVLEGPRLGGGVEEWIEEKGNVGCGTAISLSFAL